MRCKYCGGEINLSVGRCIACGQPVDAASDVRILHNLGALAEEYGLDPSDEKYSQPIKTESIPIDQRTSSGPAPLDLNSAKKPGIQLSTYYELLGEDSSEVPDEHAPSSAVQEDEGKVSESDESLRQDDDTHESDSSEDTTQRVTLIGNVSEDIKNIGVMQFARVKVSEWADKLDRVTAPITEKIRQWINAKMPQMHRAQSSSKLERLAVIGGLLIALVLVIAIISSIVASIPESISGEWLVSGENSQSMFTVEFRRGEVTAFVYDADGEPHVYRKGTYSVSRRNGHDLLTIEYEDGSKSHLYYEIDGRYGDFSNVDTGMSDRYKRID